MLIANATTIFARFDFKTLDASFSLSGSNLRRDVPWDVLASPTAERAARPSVLPSSSVTSLPV